MRRIRFSASVSESVNESPELAWTWADRLPEALTEFAFVRAVRPWTQPDCYTLELGPVGYGKVSMSLELQMRVFREPGRLIRLTSIEGTGNADATVSVQVQAAREGGCDLTISLEVSPHKPAAAFWPREWIEKASSTSLQLAARKMLSEMKAALENGEARARSERPDDARNFVTIQ